MTDNVERLYDGDRVDTRELLSGIKILRSLVDELQEDLKELRISYEEGITEIE